jgi:lambda family phage portal protein
VVAAMESPFATSSVMVSATPSRSAGAERRAPAPATVGPFLFQKPRGRVQATYDSALTTPENARHWAFADSMSAKAANSLAVRRVLRTRARYEVANNSYAQGMVDTLADDCVGTGPRLQMLTKDAGMNAAIEESFKEWSNAVNLGEKLHTARCAQTVDGEAFALFTTNPKLETECQLDVRLVEADQITTPYLNPTDPLSVDGIRFDQYQNPVEYSMLRYHPGDLVQLGFLVDLIPARNVLHMFRYRRAGQCRGVPDIMPALPLYAMLRRFTLATLAGAETAADFSAVVQSEMPPDTGDNGDNGWANFPPFDLIDIERRMMMTLPAGWKMNQFRPEVPATTYEMFKREIICEIARCLHMPYNVAAGNSSSYNYASGRLDHQTYFKAVRGDQARLKRKLLDPVFYAWLEEMWLVSDILRGGPKRLAGWPHQWFWDGTEHVDPVKEATAQTIRLGNGTTTRAVECARDGRDWREVTKQQARELRLDRKLGIQRQSPTLPVEVGSDTEGEFAHANDGDDE